MSWRGIFWSQLNHVFFNCSFESSIGRQLYSLSEPVHFVLHLAQCAYPHWHADARGWSHQDPSSISTVAAKGLRANHRGINRRATDIQRKWWKGGKCTEILYGSAAVCVRREVLNLWIQQTLRVCTTALSSHQGTKLSNDISAFCLFYILFKL